MRVAVGSAARFLPSADIFTGDMFLAAIVACAVACATLIRHLAAQARACFANAGHACERVTRE